MLTVRTNDSLNYYPRKLHVLLEVDEMEKPLSISVLQHLKIIGKTSSVSIT